MHGQQPIRPDVLVQLDVVHVSAGAPLRGVQHHKHLFRVDVHLGDRIAHRAVVHGLRTQVQPFSEDPLGLRIPVRDVDPQQARPVQQGLELVRFAPLYTAFGDQTHIHDITVPLVGHLRNPVTSSPRKAGTPPPRPRRGRTGSRSPASRPATSCLTTCGSPALAAKQDGAWIMRRRNHGGGGSDHDPALVQLAL